MKRDTDNWSDAAWELWAADLFDRESPRQIELAGHGLTAGLAALWARHLLETVQADGRSGFTRFNLWLPDAGQSISLDAAGPEAVRLKAWVFAVEPPALAAADAGLLAAIAAAHARLWQAGQTAAPILAAAGAAAGREVLYAQLAALGRR